MADETLKKPSFLSKLKNFKAGEGLNDFAGGLSAATPYISSLTNGIGSGSTGELTGKQQTTVSAIQGAAKALESVPVVGTFAKIGNAANALMPNAWAGGTAADQAINSIPGLKLLNFSVGKLDNFNINQDVQNSGYGGSASEISNTKNTLGGVNQGFLTMGNKKKNNAEINSAKQTQTKIGNVLDFNKDLKTAATFNAQSQAQASQLKRNGGFTPIAVGKNGVSLEVVKNLMKDKYSKQVKSLKNGGEIKPPKDLNSSDCSLIPGGKLHAHRHNLKDHDSDLAEQVTGKGVPVVVFKDGGEIQQIVEIEKGELVLRSEIAKKLKQLRSDGSKEAMIEAGKILSEEIVNNTKDKSGEYEINN